MVVEIISHHHHSLIHRTTPKANCLSTFPACAVTCEAWRSPSHPCTDLFHCCACACGVHVRVLGSCADDGQSLTRWKRATMRSAWTAIIIDFREGVVPHSPLRTNIMLIVWCSVLACIPSYKTPVSLVACDRTFTLWPPRSLSTTPHVSLQVGDSGGGRQRADGADASHGRG